jgi:hypothetical protein
MSSTTGNKGKKRKRRATLSVTAAARSQVGGIRVSSFAQVRNGDRKEIISKYHTLVKQKEMTEMEPASIERTKKLALLNKEMEAIGVSRLYLSSVYATRIMI